MLPQVRRSLRKTSHACNALSCFLSYLVTNPVHGRGVQPYCISLMLPESFRNHHVFRRGDDANTSDTILFLIICYFFSPSFETESLVKYLFRFCLTSSKICTLHCICWLMVCLALATSSGSIRLRADSASFWKCPDAKLPQGLLYHHPSLWLVSTRFHHSTLLQRIYHCPTASHQHISPLPPAHPRASKTR